MLLNNPLGLIQLGISMAIPPLVSLLNDPRPNRAWLRVLIVIAIVSGAALLHLAQAKTAISWQSWGNEALTLLLGSQVVHRLFKVACGKLEDVSGNGLGVLIDGLVKGSASKDDDSLEAKLNRLSELQVRGYITPTEYEAKRAAVLEENL